ncbi:MAG: M3 family oligoendopeptidase [bacterium]|nr:M3 family oligoendopeptidase [bacterium]
MKKKSFQQKEWNLKDLLPAHKGKDFENYIKSLDKAVLSFEAKRKELKNTITPNKFVEIIRLYEKIKYDSGKIFVYAQLWFSQDTKSEEARVFKAKIHQYDAELDNRVLFFSLWFKSLDEKTAKALIKATPKYSYFLERVRMFKPYTLSEAEEKILTIKEVTEREALHSLYKIITSGMMYDLELNGKILKLNRSQLTSYARHKDEKIRERVYTSLFTTFSENKDVLGEIYKNLILSWKNENVQLRKYPEPISPRNLGNNISDKAVDAMLSACKKNASSFQKYFKIKAKLLRVKKLKRESVYAPIEGKERDIPYNDAINLVLEAYGDFSPEMARLARKVIEQDHIDSKIRDTKVAGAFCYDCAPGITPYVLVNYTGKERDVTTIAHELGHAVHDLLSHKNVLLQSHPPLVLAETASVFGEMLMTEMLFIQEKDPKLKQALIASKLDDFYATIQRQAFFVLFEMKAHEAIEKGATLEEISQLWLQSLKQQFGDSVEVSGQFKYEWLTIPHIYESPFYCYSYPFGNLLTLALYQMYKEQGKNFVPKYIKFLSYGGSQEPKKICAELGIDVESEEFWEKGFKYIDTLVKDLEESMIKL